MGDLAWRYDTLGRVVEEPFGDAVTAYDYQPPQTPGTLAGRPVREREVERCQGDLLEANPDPKGKVVVHHALEQQVLKRYSNVVKPSETHSLENVRGIPKEANSDLPLSRIRREWNRLYRQNPDPTRQQLLDKATDIDVNFSKKFDPP